MPDLTKPETISARLQLNQADMDFVFMNTGSHLSHGLVKSGLAAFIMQSVELLAPESELSPPSPVSQDVHEELLSGGPALMTVGQWNKVHFSGVFQRTHEGVLHCDMAARSRMNESFHPASTYVIRCQTSDILSASDQQVGLRVSDTDELHIEAGEGVRIVLAESGRGALRLQIFKPLEEAELSRSNKATARTYQWSYTIRLVNRTEFV